MERQVKLVSCMIPIFVIQEYLLRYVVTFLMGQAICRRHTHLPFSRDWGSVYDGAVSFTSGLVGALAYVTCKLPWKT